MLTKHDSDIVKGYIVRELASLTKELDQMWEDAWKQYRYKAGRRQGIFFRKRLRDETLEEFKVRKIVSFSSYGECAFLQERDIKELNKILDRVKNCDTVYLNDEEYKLVYDN